MVLPAGDKSLLTVVCQQDILHLKNTKCKNDVISMFSKIQMFILYIFTIIHLNSCHYYLNISVDDAKIMQKP